jgi:hypothetical protein
VNYAVKELKELKELKPSWSCNGQEIYLRHRLEWRGPLKNWDLENRHCTINRQIHTYIHENGRQKSSMCGTKF